MQSLVFSFAAFQLEFVQIYSTLVQRSPLQDSSLYPLRRNSTRKLYAFNPTLYANSDRFK